MEKNDAGGLGMEKLVPVLVADFERGVDLDAVSILLLYVLYCSHPSKGVLC